MKTLQKRLKEGEHIELTNGEDLINIWFQPITGSFCLMLNAQVIKATKTFKPIQDKLNTIKSLTEVTN